MSLRTFVVATAALAALSCTGTRASGPSADTTPAPGSAPPPAPVPCGDLAAFRQLALGDPGWLAPANPAPLAGWTPGVKPTPEQRPAVLELARRWIRLCAVDATVELTRELVSFPTVSSEQPVADGPAFVAMAGFLSRWSEQNGFVFENHKNNGVWEVRTGPGDAVLSFLTHGDVVPVKDPGVKVDGDVPPGWSRPPFQAERVGDRVYGRGTEDDKGPIAASLVVMQALKRFGLEPDRPVMAVIGTGEEHDWAPMIAYAAETKKPTHVVSLDANFPVVAGESGFVAWQLVVPAKPFAAGDESCTRALEVRGGQFLTQVPGEAALVVIPKPGERYTAFVPRAEQAALSSIRPGISAITTDVRGNGPSTREVVSESGEKAPFSIGIQFIPEGGAGVFVLRTYGHAVHASVADEGHNALSALSEWASALGLCEGGIRTALAVVKSELAGDLWGERLGIGYADPLMGRLLVVPTVLRLNAEKGLLELGINMRRPTGVSNEAFHRKLDEALARVQQRHGGIVSEDRSRRHVGDPAVADLNSPLVPRLLELYAKHSGEVDPKPITIRGGTYARLFPGAVSFGPSLPGTPYRGHAPDEYVELRSIELLTRALFDLAVEPPR